MTKDLRAGMVLAVLGVFVAGAGLTNSVGRYTKLLTTEEIVNAIAPLERDTITEIVTPIVSGTKNADSIVRMLKSHHETNRIVHKAWQHFIEAQKQQSRIELLLWAGVFIACLAIVACIDRVSKRVSA